MVAGHGTFVNDMLFRCGLINVFDEGDARYLIDHASGTSGIGPGHHPALFGALPLQGKAHRGHQYDLPGNPGPDSGWRVLQLVRKPPVAGTRILQRPIPRLSGGRGRCLRLLLRWPFNQWFALRSPSSLVKPFHLVRATRWSGAQRRRGRGHDAHRRYEGTGGERCPHRLHHGKQYGRAGRCHVRRRLVAGADRFPVPYGGIPVMADGGIEPRYQYYFKQDVPDASLISLKLDLDTTVPVSSLRTCANRC